MIGQYLAEIQNLEKNLNIEKIIFKVVQMKFLAMHITNQKLSFDIFTVGNVQHSCNMIFTEYPNDFWQKKMYNFDPYNVLLAIATNIPQRLMTAFVLQDHIVWTHTQTDDCKSKSYLNMTRYYGYFDAFNSHFQFSSLLFV